MRNRRGIKRLAGVVIAMTAASGLVVLTPTAAQAGTIVSWSSNVDDVNAIELLSGQDGKVTASRCNSSAGDVGTRTLTPSGVTSGSTPMVDMGGYSLPALTPCNLQKAVGVDGTIYGGDPSAYPINKVAAYSPSGTKLWANRILVPNCSNDDVEPAHVRVGSDGNVYVAGLSFGCSNTWHLVSYTPAGVLRWHVQLGGPVQALVPYSGGVVVASQISQVLYYYGNDGSAIATTQVSENGTLDIDTRGYSVNENGVVTLGVQAWMPECPPRNGYTFYGTRYVASYDQNGLVFRYAPSACSSANEFAASQAGGASFVRVGSDGSRAIVNLSSTGVMIHETSVEPWAGIIPDTNGNILIVTPYTYPYQGATLRAMRFELLNPTNGSVLAQFSTEAIDGTHSMAVADYAMAPSRLYIVAQVCYTDNCSSVGPKHVYAINIAKMGMDYPRGKVLGVNSAVIDDMSVAGDSFTSGLGSLMAGMQYETGDCARSPSAYARVLQADTSVRLRLADFVACAGAETQHVISQSFQGEGPQAARIAPNAKSVFMTIGGNDVGFARFSTLCVLYDCTLPAVAQEFSDKFQALSGGDKLGNAYRAVLNNASNATLYVIGYPQILPLQNCHDTGSAWWLALEAAYQLPPAVLAPMLVTAGLTVSEADNAVLMGAPAVTDTELIAGNQMVNQLNLAISDAVAAVNAQPAYAGRIVYVSATAPGTPLGDRKLCSANPAFNGLDLANAGESFHPNASGQTELYLLARAALAAHQPQYVPLG